LQFYLMFTGGKMKTQLETAAVAPTGAASLHDVLRRIESEYREMPGMSVNAQQAQRLWGLDSTTCSFVMTMLVERGILRHTARGTFVRRQPRRDC
jgi:hypothetical protein